MNGLLDDYDLMAQYRKDPWLQGLLNQTAATGQQLTQPMQMPQVPTAQTPQQPDWMGLLNQQQQPEKGFKQMALPLGMGLLNMGAAMSGPYYPWTQQPPWARGVQGLSEGMMTGVKFQKAQQDELYKKAITAMALKKAFGQPEVKEIGGKKFVIGPDGKPHPLSEDKGHWATVDTPGGPTIKQLKPGEEAPAYQKPVKESFETLTYGDWLKDNPGGTRMQYQIYKKKALTEAGAEGKPDKDYTGKLADMETKLQSQLYKIKSDADKQITRLMASMSGSVPNAPQNKENNDRIAKIQANAAEATKEAKASYIRARARLQGGRGGGNIVHSSDEPLTPEQAQEILKGLP